MTLAAEARVRQRERASSIESADAPSAGPAFFQPAAGRIVAGAGLAGGRLQQALKRHGAVARRIALGRQILKIVGRSRNAD